MLAYLKEANRRMCFIPLKMQPCYKQALWGGDRLKKEFGKTDAPEITAESWELAAHPAGVSRVADGPLKGMTISELGKADRNGFWGDRCQGEEFPLLVKMIDARKDLSIQVHPSNENAIMDIGERGKAEMWYIVDSEPQAYLYFGFSKLISRNELFERAENGSICEVLNRVPVKSGDVFYILPGIVHAIGAGIVIAEIQQNSDTTFRVYDYCRRGIDGNFRQLHLKRASEVLNYEPTIPSECRANSMAIFPAFTMKEMFSCCHFKAHRLDVRSEASLYCDGSSFQHLLCVEGNGKIISYDISYQFCRGESYFLPAKLGEYQIRGNCRLLITRV